MARYPPAAPADLVSVKVWGRDRARVRITVRVRIRVKLRVRVSPPAPPAHLPRRAWWR